MIQRSGLEALLRQKLEQRESAGLLRHLSVAEGKVDFCSNDYLGFAQSAELRHRIHEEERKSTVLGSTGSRLLTGHSVYADVLERQIADFHDSPTALLFNSGYDANVGLFASLGRVAKHIVYDELIHASVHDGMRLSKANCIAFKHNDPAHLEEVLYSLTDGPAIVTVESIYSMDGDTCLLQAILNVCQKHGAELIVDEAHAVGLFGQQGRGVVHQLGLQDQVFARLITFGKALGCHGAAVLGNDVLRQFLINHARPLIYSTFTSHHALVAVKCAYDMLSDVDSNVQKIRTIIPLLKYELMGADSAVLIPSESAIQGLVVPGAAHCRAVAQRVWDDGFDVRPIVSPTVPKGSERIRICLHEFNSEDEVRILAASLRRALDKECEMSNGLSQP